MARTLLSSPDDLSPTTLVATSALAEVMLRAAAVVALMVTAREARMPEATLPDRAAAEAVLPVAEEVLRLLPMLKQKAYGSESIMRQNISNKTLNKKQLRVISMPYQCHT
jgi:hypothetical protein